MAIIVQHLRSKKAFILLGTSYSYFKDSRPSVFGGSLFPHEEDGEVQLAAVSNDCGEISWFPTDELIVMEVDGVKPADLLNRFKSVHEGREYDGYTSMEECPGCGEKVNSEDRECPSCGLALISDNY